MDKQIAQVLNYYAGQTRTPEWLDFHLALGAEFSEQLGENELRVLMQRIGGRLARQLSLGACDSLSSLQNKINAIWAQRNWGVIELLDSGDSLYIRHLVSPLVNEFGAVSIAWIGGLLEGVYEEWFKALGAGNGLHVRQAAAYNADIHSFEFVLKQVR